jgi:hypothetical protein
MTNFDFINSDEWDGYIYIRNKYGQEFRIEPKETKIPYKQILIEQGLGDRDMMAWMPDDYSVTYQSYYYDKEKNVIKFAIIRDIPWYMREYEIDSIYEQVGNQYFLNISLDNFIVMVDRLYILESDYYIFYNKHLDYFKNITNRARKEYKRIDGEWVKQI